MDEALRRTWHGLASKAWMSMHVPGAGGAQEAILAMTSFSSRFAATAADVPEGATGWDRSLQSRLVRRYVNKPDGTFAAEDAAFVKSVRYGIAVATADARWLLPSERSMAAEGGGRIGEGTPDALPYVPAGDSFDVAFRFRFKGRRPGSTAACNASSTGTALVVRVAAARAPVAVRLEAGGGRNAMEVRDFDGVPFRPVLAPGEWRPITEAEFAVACSGREAWRDDPWAPACAGPPLSLDESTEDRPEPGAAEAVARGLALEAALARVGRLVSVDGVVHRETVWPTLHPVLLGKAGTNLRIGLAWRVSGLSSTDEQGWWPNLAREKAVDARCGRGRGLADFMGVPFEHADVALATARGARERCSLEMREADVARVVAATGRVPARGATDAAVAAVQAIAASVADAEREAKGHEARTWRQAGAYVVVKECARALERGMDRAEEAAVVSKAARAVDGAEGPFESCLGPEAAAHVAFVKAALAAADGAFRNGEDRARGQADEEALALRF